MSTAQQLDTAANPAALDASSLLDSIIDQSRIATNDSEKGHTRDLISELVAQVLDGSVTVSRDLSASIDARIAELDQLISAQLSEVMHSPDFQKLESTWTGLHYLCKHTSTGERLKIKLLNGSHLYEELAGGHLAKFGVKADNVSFDLSALLGEKDKAVITPRGSLGEETAAGVVSEVTITREKPSSFSV